MYLPRGGEVLEEAAEVSPLVEVHLLAADPHLVVHRDVAVVPEEEDAQERAERLDGPRRARSLDGGRCLREEDLAPVRVGELRGAAMAARAVVDHVEVVRDLERGLGEGGREE